MIGYDFDGPVVAVDLAVRPHLCSPGQYASATAGEFVRGLSVAHVFDFDVKRSGSVVGAATGAEAVVRFRAFMASR